MDYQWARAAQTSLTVDRDVVHLTIDGKVMHLTINGDVAHLIINGEVVHLNVKDKKQAGIHAQRP